MLTAIGIDTKYGGVGAVEVKTTNKNEVEKALKNALGMHLDMVIIVGNGKDSPEVLIQWKN